MYLVQFLHFVSTKNVLKKMYGRWIVVSNGSANRNCCSMLLNNWIILAYLGGSL